MGISKILGRPVKKAHNLVSLQGGKYNVDIEEFGKGIGRALDKMSDKEHRSLVFN